MLQWETKAVHVKISIVCKRQTHIYGVEELNTNIYCILDFEMLNV